jgi:mono/diheme cytochrome c family protein
MLEAAWWMRAGLVADLWDRHPVAIPGAIHAAGALIAALITLGFVLRRPVPRRPGRFSRLARAGQRVLLVLVAGPVLALNVLLAVPLLAHAARVWPVRHGVAQFRERCSTCHAPGAPLYFVDTDEELSARLSVVDIAAKAKLTAGEEESIRSFVQGMRGFPAAWTFRSRCQRCHVLSSWTWDGRHRDDWRMIVDRVAAATPAYFSDSVRDQLTRYLSETRGDPDGLPGMDPGAYSLAVQTIGACSECHRFGRAADAHEDQTLEEAREVVRRMSGYRVAPFSDAEIDTMAAAYREILSDREAREHLVPHETPVLWERWLGW